MNDPKPYATGAAGLFAAMARSEALPEEPTPVLHEPVPCWRCLSDDTEILDHEHDLYRCLNCGEVFVRAAPAS